MRRAHRIEVLLDDDELAQLDEIRDAPRAVFLRELLRGASPSPPLRVKTHEEVLAVLSKMADDGRVAAAIALERALRAEQDPALPEGELARLLRGD